MGVDWYACESCSDTFPDCGDYVGCECGRHWCSDECAEGDGFREEEDGFTPEGSSWEQESSCNFCRGEQFDEDELLDMAIELLGKTRVELIALLQAKKKGAK